MRKIYILSHLHDNDIDWMADTGRVLELADGELLIRESVAVEHLFVLLNGSAQVEAGGAGVVAVLREGDVVGEMAFVDNAPPSASVRAVGPLEYLAVEKHRLQERLDSDVSFAARFYKALAVFLSERLRKANALVRNPASEEDKFHHLLDRLQAAKA